MVLPPQKTSQPLCSEQNLHPFTGNTHTQHNCMCVCTKLSHAAFVKVTAHRSTGSCFVSFCRLWSRNMSFHFSGMCIQRRYDREVSCMLSLRWVDVTYSTRLHDNMYEVTVTSYSRSSGSCGSSSKPKARCNIDDVTAAAKKAWNLFCIFCVKGADGDVLVRVYRTGRIHIIEEHFLIYCTFHRTDTTTCTSSRPAEWTQTQCVCVSADSGVHVPDLWTSYI